MRSGPIFSNRQTVVLKAPRAAPKSLPMQTTENFTALEPAVRAGFGCPKPDSEGA
jgi:hypothetical protein